ncbi:MAG: hypothetical protein L6Q95_09700 [Planctomycetes bacterium]|nr:hypothetical protein [Planctomycetota bacterium]
MGRIIYREFLGSRLVLTALFLCGIGIPLAVIYVLEYTITVEEDVESPSDYVASWRARRPDAR